ncbi:MAG TPA: S9 family peptidase [Anaerolineales bacterium]|nr:S9 family peptidase [Anaerolineales bacterium]
MPSKKSTLAAEDLYKYNHISHPRLSPDGRHVIYVLNRVDQKMEKKYTTLWLVPTGKGQPRQFTYGDQIDSSPEWSPDGSEIAFLSNRGDKDKPSQIYLLPFHGGEARPLTDIRGSIQSFSWSPNGKKLLCTVQKTDSEELEREKDEQKKKLGTVARHYDRVFYKMDGVGYRPHERTHVWVVDTRTGKGKQLTDHPVFDEDGPPAWSPDGKWIAFVSNRHENPDFNTDADDLFLLPAGGGEFRKIETVPGSKFFPVFSPDGKWIAYYGPRGHNQWYKNTSLWVVPVDGSETSRNLTEAYDLHISDGTLNDTSGTETNPPTWSNDSRRIYFSVDKHGSTWMMSLNVDGTDLQTHTRAGITAHSISFDQARTGVAYLAPSLSSPGQIITSSPQSSKEHTLTKHNHWLNRFDLGQVEEIWYKGAEDNDLQGWIIKPPNFDPQKKYPSIMEIHGGPLLQYGHHFMHEFYSLAAQGYVVYYTNPRGGRGYGEAHAKSIWGAWGTTDYADLMCWADYAQNLPYIDPDRMGVTGGSYGGYMTLWIIGHTTRFKAAVAQRVVSNFVSMWGSSDFNWNFQHTFGDVPPYKDINNAWNCSPMKYIGNAKTPTLIIHSENDLRCPIEQGEQAFVALKQLGLDSEFVRFPEEYHGLSRGGRTDRRIARLNHILRWFEKYLK